MLLIDGTFFVICIEEDDIVAKKRNLMPGSLNHIYLTLVRMYWCRGSFDCNFSRGSRFFTPDN